MWLSVRQACRPGDEVIVVYRGKVAGVGKAALSGTEMVRAKKGLAVAMRHRQRSTSAGSLKARCLPNIHI